MSSFYIGSTGCLRTGPETQRIHAYFIANGYLSTDDPAAADILIMNTCGYIQAAEDETMRCIEALLDQKKESARMVALGCLASINAERLRSAGQLTILGSGMLDQLDQMIGAHVRFATIPQPLTALGPRPGVALPKLHRPSEPHELTIRVSDGCLHNCAYCAIKFAKGNVRSTPIPQIVEQMNECIRQGAEIIYLATDDLGCYGQDLKTTVVDLLETLFAIEGTYKLKLHDLNAYWFLKYYDRLRPVLLRNVDRILYLFVTVEGGSDDVLRRMKRRYPIDDVRRAFHDLRSAAPRLPLRCSIMVGFPGETQDDYERTRDFVRDISSLDDVNIWLTPYCDRPGTAASQMDDKVDQAVIDQRHAELTHIVGSTTRITSMGLRWPQAPTAG